MPRGGAREGAGRKPGIPNKINTALKEMILGALGDAGGQKYLARQANENPAAFMTLLGKVLPTTLAGDPNNPVASIQRIDVVLVPPPPKSEPE